MKKTLLTGAALTLLAGSASALTISQEDGAGVLADALFLNLPGLEITSSQLSVADPSQTALYSNEDGTYGLPVNGIMLSTGVATDFGYGEGPTEGPVEIESYGVSEVSDDVSSEIGNEDGENPSDEEPHSFNFGLGVAATDAQQDLLEPISGQEYHADVAQLDIEFNAAPDVDSVTFFATFQSQEWPEYVGGSFVDSFGLYVNGSNVAAAQVSGATAGDTPLAININHPDMITDPAANGGGVLAPNGNPVLRFDVPVKSGDSNLFQIILADAGDGIVDTTTFISSFVPTEVQINTGASEFDPLLPSNPPDPETGAFEIALPELPDNEFIWIDPPVAVGYQYTLNGPGYFTGVLMPSLATIADLDGYLLTVNGQNFNLGAGQSIDISTLMATTITISGIDPQLGLDPADQLAFPLGVSFMGLGNGSSITMLPLTVDTDVVAPVPLPAAAPLMLAGFGLLGGIATRRRRRRAA